MTPERWKRTEDLYHAARARAPGERAAFLAEACPDDEALRHDVASLLDERSDDGFLAPALVTATHPVSGGAPAVMAGRTLSGYHLQTLLGAGGMGEVYRAHDPKLGRDVAIKILPRAFTSDPDRLARFEREARMLAALNHPNICAIYGIEKAEADGIRFLVLELVDGKTLADTLADGSRMRSPGSGLPLHDALTIARQIADALEVAHEKGIIHRDLKPANITITPDGVVKVLDFGLAKAVGGDGSTPDLTQARVTWGGSVEGAVMGTAAYMSPEQARGVPVDKRTDIWAFGCVLYEMLTGRVTFAGDTVSDSIAKILEREPDWAALPAATPAPIRRLLLRCLTKDPKKRLRDIGDVRIEIDAIDDVLPGISEGAHPAIPKTRTTWLPWVALVALATGVAVWEATRPTTIENPLAHAQFTSLTSGPGSAMGAEISPDGKFVVFLSDRAGEFDLWWGQIGTGDFRNLTLDLPPMNALGADSLVRSFGFNGNGSEIWFSLSGEQSDPKVLMPQTGGTRRPFLPDGDATPSWSPDGTRLVFEKTRVGGDPLFLADPTGKDPILVGQEEGALFEKPMHNHNPVWSTDSEWIYFVHGLDPIDEMDIRRLRPLGGRVEQVLPPQPALAFLTPLNPRTLLYLARAPDRSGPWLWSLDVPTKTPRRMVSGLERYTSVSASRDGSRVVVTRANPTASLWRVPLRGRQAGDGDAQPYPVQTLRALSPRFGGTSLFYLSANGTGDGLWRFQDGKALEIWRGADSALAEPPAVSPDGQRIAVIERKAGRRHLVSMGADGTGRRTLAPSIKIEGTADWSPDGKWIATGGIGADGRPGLFKIPVDGGGEPVRLVDGQANSPVWSPTDNVIVYAGRMRAGQVPLLGVRPDGTPAELPTVWVSPGGYRFLPDGTGLVYLPRSVALDFWFLDLMTNKPTRPLTHLSYQGSLRTFDITRDGEYIVFDRSRENSDIVLIDLPKK